METPIEQISSRIQKLLALTTTNGATEEEMNTALSFSRLLLDKYNLTLSNILSREESLGSQGTIQESRPPEGPPQPVKDYHLTLARSISSLYDCSLVVFPFSTRIGFIGLPLDLSTTRQIYDTIILQLDILFNMHQIMQRKLFRDSFGNEGKRKSSFDSFALGVVTELQHRINNIKASRTPGTLQQQNQLIIHKSSLIKKYIQEKFSGRFTNSQQTKTTDNASYLAGKEISSKIAVSHTTSNNTVKQLTSHSHSQT